MKREPILIAVIAGGLLLMIAIAVYNYWPSRAEPLPPPAVVAQQLTASESIDVQVKAAHDFIRHGPAARVEVRTALQQHARFSPDVVAPLLQATAKNRDYRSMPVLIELLNDPDPLVRGQAGVAVQKILGADFGFRAELPESERQRIIKLIQQDYQVSTPRLLEVYQGQSQ